MTERPIKELQAGNAFRDTLVPKADAYANGHAPLWHGWAIMDAFLAGIDWGRNQPKALTLQKVSIGVDDFDIDAVHKHYGERISKELGFDKNKPR